MTAPYPHIDRPPAGRLWFGLLGGPVAWAAAFVAAYLMAESACVTGGSLTGVGVVWVLAAIIALAATVAHDHRVAAGLALGLDAALDAADVEAQAGQAAEALMAVAVGKVQGLPAPGQRLVHGTVGRSLLAGGMAGAAGKAQPHRADAAMGEHGPALHRYG